MLVGVHMKCFPVHMKHTQAETIVGEMRPSPRPTNWCLDGLPEGEFGEFRSSFKSSPTPILSMRILHA